MEYREAPDGSQVRKPLRLTLLRRLEPIVSFFRGSYATSLRDVDSASQEARRRFLASLDKPEPDPYHRAYASTLVRNVFTDALRKQRARDRRESKAAEGNTQSPRREGGGVFASVARGEDRDFGRRLVELLEEFRQIRPRDAWLIERRTVMGAEYEEIYTEDTGQPFADALAASPECQAAPGDPAAAVQARRRLCNRYEKAWGRAMARFSDFAVARLHGAGGGP